MEKITVKEAAARWGLTENKVREMCRNGEIPGAEKTSAGWLIPVEKEEKKEEKPLNEVKKESTAVQNTEKKPHPAQAQVKKANTAQAENTDQLFKNTVGFAALSFVAVVAVIVGIGIMIAGEAFGGFMTAAIAGFFSWLFIACLKTQVTASAKRIEEEKAAGKNYLKKKYILAGVVAVLSVSFIAVIAGTIYGTNEASYINYKAEKMLEEAVVDESVFEDLEEFDEYYSEKDPIAKLFFSYKDEIEQLRAEADAFVAERAKEVEEGINNLKPCTKLSSYEEYAEKKNEIDSLRLSADDSFEKRVRSLVTNYADYEKYCEDFDSLCSNYIRKCTACGGDGSSSSSCGSCGGSGKKLVTWYSQGDWGETSYSSYTCGSCNGSGRSRRSCGACNNGYIYNFGK